MPHAATDPRSRRGSHSHLRLLRAREQQRQDELGEALRVGARGEAEREVVARIGVVILARKVLERPPDPELELRRRAGAAHEARVEHVRVPHVHLDVAVVRMLEGVGHLPRQRCGAERPLVGAAAERERLRATDLLVEEFRRARKLAIAVADVKVPRPQLKQHARPIVSRLERALHVADQRVGASLAPCQLLEQRPSWRHPRAWRWLRQRRIPSRSRGSRANSRRTRWQLPS